MHKSRLGAIVIDSQGVEPEEAGQFWSRAFGYPLVRAEDPEDAHYASLETPSGEVVMILQTVDHPSRVHLDIETDDIDAEVKRLESLGARRISAIRTWVVMEAPTGHRFCLVPPGRAGFDDKATEWPS